jgi:tetratricopeptide (TPR) repeat protein
MAKDSRHKKTKIHGPAKSSPPAKKSGAKKPSKVSRAKTVPKRKPVVKKPQKLAQKKSSVKAKPAPHAGRGEKKNVQLESPKAVSIPAPVVVPPAPLLRQTKTTSAALALLGKGVELIFQKNFKKAKSELKSLLELYPEEMDILARARSYIQICDREETALKKHNISSDQLYALGVLEHNKANYEAAIGYFLQSLEKHPDADYIYYSVAASQAMKGDLDHSIENLRKAVDLNEDSRIYAKNDSDFSALQARSEFAELVGLNQPPSE